MSHASRKALLFSLLLMGTLIPTPSDAMLLRIGPLKDSGATRNILYASASPHLDKVRLEFIQRNTLPSWNRFGLDTKPVSFTYQSIEGKPYGSLNPGILFMIFGLAYTGACSEGNMSISYGGMSTMCTLYLAPQVLTNWSLRFDLVPGKAGVWAGPNTDLLPRKGPALHPDANTGAYLTLGDLDMTLSASHDFRLERSEVRFGIGWTGIPL